MDKPSNKSLEQQLPQSVDLGIEKPKNEYDNTSLKEAFTTHLTDTDGNVIIPEPNAIPRHEIDTEETSTDTEQGKSPRSRFWKIGGVVAAATATAALAIGLNLPKENTSKVEENVPTPDPKPTSQETSTAASPSPVKTASPSPEATTETKPNTIDKETLAKLEGYDKLDGDSFNALPKSEQEQYRKWKFAGLTEYAASYYNFTKKPEDMLVKPSQENTAQQVVTIQTYYLRYIVTLEPSERENALISVLAQGKASPAYKRWMDAYAQIPMAVENPKVLASNNTIPVPTGVSFTSDFVQYDNYLERDIYDPAQGTTTPFFFDTTAIDPVTKQVSPEWSCQ